MKRQKMTCHSDMEQIRNVLVSLKMDLAELESVIYDPHSLHYIKSRLCDAEYELRSCIKYLEDYTKTLKQ